jgi:pyrroline-5-carboxylate reductase
MIDVATAISGSGPAYVLYFMDSLIKAAIEMGFSPSEAELLVVQTFRGTTDMFNQSNESAENWIDKVASKGGTTEAALIDFAKSKLDKSIKQGAKSALERAIELGQK